MLVLGGLDQKRRLRWDSKSAATIRAPARLVTGAHARMTSGADLAAPASRWTKVAAQEFGKYTQLASLEVGLESPEIVGAANQLMAAPITTRFPATLNPTSSEASWVYLPNSWPRPGPRDARRADPRPMSSWHERP